MHDFPHLPMKPKVQVVEMIPPAFVEFLEEVDGMIERRDPETLLESDDLIQCEHTFGGLVDAAEELFGFEFWDGTKFSKNGFRITSHFLLTKSQIKAVANHELTSLTMWRCSNDCGRRATVSDWHCTECDNVP